MQNLEELSRILACPACHGDLRVRDDDGRSGFECPACGVVYPVRDDIPVMLVEEAIPLDEWQQTGD